VNSTEERLSQLLHTAAPDAAEIAFDDIKQRVRRRRRTTVSAAVIATILVIVAAISIPAILTDGGSTQSLGTTLTQPGEPPLIGWTTATKTGVLDGTISFAPPNDPQAAIAPRAALDAAWKKSSHASAAHLILAHVSAPAIHVNTDAWFVILDGTCVPNRGPKGGPCEPEPTAVVVNASNGHYLFSLTGGLTPLEQPLGSNSHS
jgi:hypothetical protein